MRRKMQAQDEEKILVGMDAHSEKLELCVARWTHGSDPVRCKSITTTVDALESTYLKQVPQGSLTLIEASQNTFSIVERLRRIGYEAKVLNSDVLKGMARRDRINDRIDAENLAKAYARGHGREVHVPGEKHREYRDVLFGYFSATKDALRSWNRVWGFCSAHGMKLPKGGRLNAAKNVESALKDATLTETQRFVGNMDVEQFKSALELKGRFQRQIELTVSKDKDMQALMQILGFRFIVSFALVAFVEDVRRFPTPSKLVAYVGLNPRMNSSGKDEGGNAMTSCGIPRLKALVTEAAQISLRRGDASAPEGARNRGCADFPEARRRPDASLGATEARRRQAVQQGHRRSRAQDGRLRMACLDGPSCAELRNGGVVYEETRTARHAHREGRTQSAGVRGQAQVRGKHSLPVLSEGVDLIGIP